MEVLSFNQLLRSLDALEERRERGGGRASTSTHNCVPPFILIVEASSCRCYLLWPVRTPAAGIVSPPPQSFCNEHLKSKPFHNASPSSCNNPPSKPFHDAYLFLSLRHLPLGRGGRAGFKVSRPVARLVRGGRGSLGAGRETDGGRGAPGRRW